MLAFNDFFVGVRSHVSARYRIYGERPNGIAFVQRRADFDGGGIDRLDVVRFQHGGGNRSGTAGRNRIEPPRLNWDDPRLLWAVREPFVSRTSQAGLVCGTLEGGAADGD